MIEELIKLSITVITFSVAAVKDWKTREITPYIWIPSLSVGLILGVLKSLGGLTIYQILSVSVSLIVVFSIAVLVFVCKLMGGADLLAVASFCALYPYTLYTPLTRIMIFSATSMRHIILILPPILVVFLIHSIVMIFIIIHNVIQNIRHIDFLNGLRIPVHKKLYFIIFYRVIDIDTMYRRRFYYPILVPGRIERSIFNIYEDDLMWRKMLSDMPRKMRIVASWGIPMVTFFSISVFIYLVIHLLIPSYI